MVPARVRAPRYLTRFQCIGAACEDSCCAGWQGVDVDAATYARYRDVDHAELGPALRRWVQPNPAPSGPEEHALIEVPPGGCCPFFRGDRLCAIQAVLGEAWLPASCDTFPRQATQVDGVIELAGRFACPEITRLALLAPDALELVEIPPDRRLTERACSWVEVPWPEPVPPPDPRRAFHRLRARCLALLRRPDAALEARLQALGLALEALDAWSGLDDSALDEVFTAVGARLPLLQRQLAALQGAGPHGPAPLLIRRLWPWLAMADLPARYRVCLERVRDGLGLSASPSDGPEEAVARAYARALPRFRAYLERRPYLLEHVLLNHLLLSTFPFHPQHTFFEEYAVLACRLALLKLHLVGAAAVGELTDELVVETVQAFDKYPDSPDYWRRTLELLRREGALSPAGVAALLID